MSERPWLILPIETKVRELDAKVYLACVAAEAGFRVIIGEQNALLRRLALLPCGYYFDKSVARPKVRAFERLRRLGFRIVACCEEGLVYRNREAYLNERVAPEAMARVDRFFAWGGAQHKDVASAVPSLESRILDTGNPRFDLLRPGLRELYRPAADRLRDRFGEFILVNTNFGRFNHFFGRSGVMELLRKRGSIRSAADESFFEGWIDFLGAVFASFEMLLPALSAAFPDRTIILRPHPSENHETWRTIVRNLSNVQVICEGSAVPWMMAAVASIHNSCTTGLEAALLDRPVFAYRTVRSEVYDSFLPNRVSVEAASAEELLAGIAAVLDGQYAAPLAEEARARTAVESYIASASGPDAAQRIVEHLVDLSRKSAGSTPAHVLAPVRDHGEQVARALVRTALAPLRASHRYAKQKFSGLTVAEVEELVQRYQALTGRFSGVKVRRSHPQSATISTD